MRKQHFAWTFLVTSIVLFGYGTYSIIYNTARNHKVPVLGIIFTIVGFILLFIYIVLLIISVIQKVIYKSKQKKEVKPVEPASEVKAEPVEEEKPVIAEPIIEEKKVSPSKKSSNNDEVTYVRTRVSYRDDDDGGSGYVKLVGYGPVLRVTGNDILDMRSNTYYRIEGRMIHQNGYGPVYEIYGDKVRVAFGSYLYEISGDSISKVFGGYFASFSGGYLQTYDLKYKYEVSFSLTKKQKLAIVAILFGSY